MLNSDHAEARSVTSLLVPSLDPLLPDYLKIKLLHGSPTSDAAGAVTIHSEGQQGEREGASAGSVTCLLVERVLG